MNHPTPRALAYLLLIGCNLIAGCSLQVPKEEDVFGKGSLGGEPSGGSTSTSATSTSAVGGSTANTGGTKGSSTAGGSVAGGAGGTTAPLGGNTSSAGGALAGGSSGTGTSAVGGTVAMGGTAAAGGAGGAGLGGNVTLGGTNSAGGAVNTTGGTKTTTAGGTSATVGGTSTVGGATTGGAATGGAATGGAATGGAATGGAATGGVPPVGGAPPQVILQYKFEEGTGTTALDSTTNHYDGTLVNVSWSSMGRNGSAANYAAVDSNVTIPSTLLGTSRSLTVSAWVNLTTNAAENRLFYFGTADATSYLTLTLNNSTNGISLRFKAASGSERVLTTPSQLPLGIWKHVAVSVSNVGAAIYVDGKIVARDNKLDMDPTTLGTPMTNFVGSSPTAGQAFQGLIDEFYVYNGVLPLSDIRQLAWPKSDYSMYHLDEGTGTTTVDSSDRAINGVLVGGATWVASPFGTGVSLSNNPVAAPAEQYVDLGDGLVSDCSLNLTLAGWFNIVSNTTDAPLLEFGMDTNNYVNIQTYSTGVVQPVFSFIFNNSGTQRVVRLRGYTGWVLNTWTHIAVTRSGTDGRPVALYQNGVKQGTGSTNTGALFNAWGGPTTLNALGKATSDTIPGFNGAVDEVLVSCRAYTDDEIKQLAYLPPN